MPRIQPHINALSPYQTSMTLEQLARKHSIKPENIVQLASNENPYGMSPKVGEAIAQVAANRYPEPIQLREKLATFYNVTPAHIITGNGSNDVIEMIARTYLAPSYEAIHTQYSYSMYQVATQTVGAANIVVPAQAYNHDLPALEAAITPQTHVIWLTNPNNPTGTFTPYQDIKAFLQRVPQDIIIVLDEAYYEYVPHELRADTVRWLAAFPNLIIVRTFSKAYGMAGIRAGYGIAAPKVIQHLEKVRSPFSMSSLALAAAIAALDDQDFIQKSYEKNLAEKQFLLNVFTQLGIASLPAYGNFITIEVANAQDIAEKLMQRGIIVRPLAGYGLPNHIRITIGETEENKKLIAELQNLL